MKLPVGIFVFFILWLQATALVVPYPCHEPGLEKKNEHHHLEPCATELYRELQEQRHPWVKTLREEIELQTSLFLKNAQQADLVSEEIIVIPVVVHILYNPNTPAQNISDQQVRNQIALLNRDFARQNPDTVNTPAEFREVASDTRIRFELAHRDPAGNPSTGITRTPTSVMAFSVSADNAKFDNTGGKSIWNRDDYMNIWVCNIEANVIGYAQYPGGPAQTDGIVISFMRFGAPSAGNPQQNIGRTLVHEVGHWLNLLHTWGDESTCGASDFVADTPEQESPYYGCPLHPQESCGSNDMFMNYMDYTDDHCMNIFTLGQVGRMRATLNTFRSPLKTSEALLSPDPFSFFCEDLNNVLLFSNLEIFPLEAGGYATGNNFAGDRAKARFFSNHQGYEFITDGAVKFGVIAGSSGQVKAAIWNLHPGSNRPANPPVATVAITWSKIVQDVAAGRVTHFEFEAPVPVSGGFFAGVILPDKPGDTLAIFGSRITTQVPAWEQWADGTWHNFEEGWQGEYNIDLAIFPRACAAKKPVPSNKAKIVVGPVPIRSFFNLFIDGFDPYEVINISITDLTGKEVFKRFGIPFQTMLTFELGNVMPTGIYFFQVFSASNHVIKKIIVVRDP